MKPLNIDHSHKIEVSRKKKLAFLELNIAADYIMESLHNKNIPTKLKKDFNVLIPFLEATMQLVANEENFKNSTVLSQINYVSTNYINRQLRLNEENLAIGLFYLSIVMNLYKMDSVGFKIVNNKGESKLIAGSLVIRKLLKDKIIPFYNNQIDKVFVNSNVTKKQFELFISKDIQRRIKIALNNENIK